MEKAKLQRACMLFLISEIDRLEEGNVDLLELTDSFIQGLTTFLRHMDGSCSFRFQFADNQNVFEAEVRIEESGKVGHSIRISKV